jgi:hypothetical protein
MKTDKQLFAEYCKTCTDSQVLGVIAKERAAVKAAPKSKFRASCLALAITEARVRGLEL